MLPEPNRLKRSSLFSKTLSAGKVLASSPYMVILGLPRLYNSDSPTRFGFVISKKISKKATIRNKIRRRLRELIRNRLPLFLSTKCAPYIAVVLIARQGILDLAYNDLEQILSNYMEKR